jgi:urea transport system ATP-binding protein
MDFMRSFATSVSVLARGKVIAEGSVAQVQANPKVQEVYFGSGKTFERRGPGAVASAAVGAA